MLLARYCSGRWDVCTFSEQGCGDELKGIYWHSHGQELGGAGRVGNKSINNSVLVGSVDERTTNDIIGSSNHARRREPL